MGGRFVVQVQAGVGTGARAGEAAGARISPPAAPTRIGGVRGNVLLLSKTWIFFRRVFFFFNALPPEIFFPCKLMLCLFPLYFLVYCFMPSGLAPPSAREEAQNNATNYI